MMQVGYVRSPFIADSAKPLAHSDITMRRRGSREGRCAYRICCTTVPRTLADTTTTVTEFAMPVALRYWLGGSCSPQCVNAYNKHGADNMPVRQLLILGTRGIPARHGGFETFAERLALYLTQRGWEVTVYCQGETGQAETIEETWHGIRRVIIPVMRAGPIGTMDFDWKSIRDAVKRRPALALTLGYNTAAFCMYLRWHGISNVINMDGLEWRREKWKLHQRAWLWLNERIGCWVANQLIADHPAIADHLATRVKRRKIATIPYGADPVASASREPLEDLGLGDIPYGLVIARSEPENSVLEIVTAFSRRPRGAQLVVLGSYDPFNAYHRKVLDAASNEVLFPGAIYDQITVRALRHYAHFYLHGHQVGGTNPSLVEALGAGSAVIAHDNVFNRWVAGPQARFFVTEADCDMHISALLADPATARAMGAASSQRFETAFRWDNVLAQYEALLERHLDRTERSWTTRPVSPPAAVDRQTGIDVNAPAAAGGNHGLASAAGAEVLQTNIE
jgi:glycosyltransferase involved in cell wall biosynthesis